MSVQEQIPYQSFTANGETTDFYINFHHEGAENIVVRVNGEVAGYGLYIYLEEEKIIQFFDAPEANQIIEIFRKTPLERETDYDSYTNRLRPETLNKDLDKIWLNLQEQALKVDQYDYDYNYILKQVRPIKTGGTGAYTAAGARENLDVYNKNEVLALVQTGGAEEVLSIANGGTGATTASQARTNLDVYSKTESNFLALPLGTPIWHNGTRLTIDDGYASYDGQLLKRADFPSLWAKVQSKFVVITDADWLADPKKRAAYSSGNGTTTFRMPDLNGFLADSIKGLHLRGDGNGTIAGEIVGQSTILTDAIRNITGQFIGGGDGTSRVSTWFTNTNTGAFALNAVTGGASKTNGAASGSEAASAIINVDASRVVPTAGENRPVSAVGIWICRVSTGTAEQVLPNTAPSLTGGNTWGGSQSVQGNLTVSGKLEADIKPLLNATGEAPVYACRAWVNFKGIDTVAINASGNVLSITDNGTGDYTINFDKPMPHANYCLVGTASQGSTASGVTSANVVAEYKSTSSSLSLKTINAVRIATIDNNQDSFFDSFTANVAIFC